MKKMSQFDFGILYNPKRVLLLNMIFFLVNDIMMYL